ncbi:MAG: MoxR family ATPase [Lachnospiraceae bacterium]|nr:MoxR family ATPase [Lachnospiraceae bacterium]MEE0863402.1 MoxR family ATPase [Lachnospiraceae bacterium]
MGNNVNVDKVLSEVKKAITGKDDCISKVFAAILAGGHILIEDVPGVGKTTLAIAFSKALSLVDRRMQFTPDVMPADILGFNMYQKETGKFVYYPGAIMCNLFLADEINRTSPKTQSALLEVMEEQKVTIEGETRDVPNPFVVMATQNPKGSAGTQLLPEAQIDRFMICVSMGYPNLKDEVEILKGKSVSSTTNVNPVLSKEQLMKIKEEVEAVHVSDKLYAYIAMLSVATREHSYIELGLSPRGSIACAKMAKAWAYLKGRNYVLPEDVVDIFLDVAKHRIVLNTKARVARVSERAVLEEILSQVKQPASYMQKVEYSV